jgi:uncharacterized protein YcfL
MSPLESQRPIITLLAGVCLIASCASTTQSGKGAANELMASSELVGDPLIEKELEVLRPHVDQSGITKVLMFDLHNRSSERLSFAYAIAWSDRADKCVGSPQRSWRLLTLDVDATVSLMVPFPADGAESWRLLAVRPEGIR